MGCNHGSMDSGCKCTNDIPNLIWHKKLRLLPVKLGSQTYDLDLDLWCLVAVFTSTSASLPLYSSSI